MNEPLTGTKVIPFVPRVSPRRTPAQINTLLGHYKSSARERRLEFSISDDLARHLFRSPCEYCEMPANPELNGIDRVDSDIGYVEENVVACCKFCNRAKWTFSADEFRWWLKNLKNNWDKAIYVHQRRGRPRTMKDCPICEERFSAREFRVHLRLCKKEQRRWGSGGLKHAQ